MTPIPRISKLVNLDWSKGLYTCDPCKKEAGYSEWGHDVIFGQPYCQQCGTEVHDFRYIREKGRQDRLAKEEVAFAALFPPEPYPFGVFNEHLFS